MVELMDPERMAIFGVLEGCAGWFVGLMLVAVGLVSVRKKHALGGYLVAGAGALQFLSSCCSSWQGPAYTWWGVGAGLGMVGMLSGIASFLTYAAMFALFIGAAVVISKKIIDAPKGGV